MLSFKVEEHLHFDLLHLLHLHTNSKRGITTHAICNCYIYEIIFDCDLTIKLGNGIAHNRSHTLDYYSMHSLTYR